MTNFNACLIVSNNFLINASDFTPKQKEVEQRSLQWIFDTVVRKVVKQGVIPYLLKSFPHPDNNDLTAYAFEKASFREGAFCPVFCLLSQADIKVIEREVGWDSLRHFCESRMYSASMHCDFSNPAQVRELLLDSELSTLKTEAWVGSKLYDKGILLSQTRTRDLLHCLEISANYAVGRFNTLKLHKADSGEKSGGMLVVDPGVATLQERLGMVEVFVEEARRDGRHHRLNLDVCKFTP